MLKPVGIIYLTTTDGEIMSAMSQEKIKILTALDRCDRCNAQAFVVAKSFEGNLFFCSHHYNKWETAIRDWAYEIIDERDFINEKSQSSA